MDQSSIDALIIGLGAGLENKTKDDPPYMWIGGESELRAASAGKLWQENANALIIFTGGRFAGPGTPSGAEAMKSYVERPPWNVPANKVLTENRAIDTASNVRNVVAIIREQKLPTDNVIMIAGNSNLGRAVAYFRAYGICVTPKLARNVLGDDIQKYNLPTVSDAMTMKARLYAFILRIEQFFDRKGTLVTWYKRYQLDRQGKSYKV